MSKKNSNKPRQMDFAHAMRYLSQLVDERSDTKFLENSKQITGPLTSLKMRVEVLEDLLMEKLGETEDSLAERVFIRAEKAQGLQQIDEPVKLGSVVSIKVKEELAGEESPNNVMSAALMVVGRNEIHPSIDTMLIGAKAGDTKSAVLPHPKEPTQSLKVTVFLARVFKGPEIVKNEEAKSNETPSAPSSEPQAAQS